MPDRPCACGCPTPITEDMRADAIYASDACATRVRRRRKNPTAPEGFWARLKALPAPRRGWTPRAA